MNIGQPSLQCLTISYCRISKDNQNALLISQMDSLSLSIQDYFLCNHLNIYPITVRSNLKDSKNTFKVLSYHFSQLPEYIKLIIMDSITILVSHGNSVAIIDFFAACKALCDNGRSIILVAHSYAFEEDILARTRSLCDARFKLKLEQVGDRMVKVMEVLKVRGADRPTGDIVSFDIEPKIGMRIIPLAKARV
ncbi:hypothetical protein ES703_66095 [subsurface metagenome]